MLNKYPPVYREGQLQCRLPNGKKTVFFNDSQYEKIYHNGSKPAKI